MNIALALMVVVIGLFLVNIMGARGLSFDDWLGKNRYWGKRDMTTLYAVVFVGVFPALWILAKVFDHIMPPNSGRYSPTEDTDEDRPLNREPLL